MTILERLQSHLADRYSVERELGKGGMATVYLAKDVRHDREVAIKVLHPELSASIGAERFEREIKLSAKLQHPHILGMFDSGEADGLLYYGMPFVKGESLRDRLDREGQLTIEDSIQITLEVADALGYAHAQGVIHRDIKPENILLSGGHALVADFGIARAATEGGAQKLTSTGMAVGTPVYMAPEQSVGDAVGPTSDLYSLGCVLYEMLAGEPPFTAKNPQALMARHAMEAVPSIRIIRQTVPEEVEDAIFAAMAKVPADRPQNAAQFSEILGAQLGQTASMRATLRHTAARRMPTGTYRTGGAVAAPAWWRKPWVMAAGFFVLAGAAFGGYKLMARSKPGTLSGTDLANAKQIAVLYFDTAESDSTLTPIAEGLTEELIKTLRGAGLFVRPGTSVAPYRGKSIGADSIAKVLKVGTIVAGSIRPESKNQVRITTRISDATGAELATPANFVIARDSLFKAEDAVATNVANGLRTVLGQIDFGETRARAGNLQAYTLYNSAEKNRKDAETAGRSDPKAGIRLLGVADSLAGAAVAADSKWIDPLVLRGDIARQRTLLETDKAEKAKAIEAGKLSVEQALKLNPNDANALAMRGRLRHLEWQNDYNTNPATRQQLLIDATNDLETATRTDPRLATAFAALSQVYYDRKDVSAAQRNAQKAYDADQYLRNIDFIYYRLFWTNYDLQNFPEADRYCTEAHGRFPADYRFVACKLWLQLAPNLTPSIPEAWTLARRIDSLLPKGPDGQLTVPGGQYQSHLAHLVVGGVIGRVARGTGPVATGALADSAHHVIERARADIKVDPRQELVGYEGLMRTQMGEYSEAFTLLKTYVGLNPDHSFKVGGRVHWWWQDLTNKPEFQQLLARGG